MGCALGGFLDVAKQNGYSVSGVEISKSAAEYVNKRFGLEVHNGDAMSFCRQLLDLDILANDSHGHTIRISPPLIINEDEMNYILERLEKILVGKKQSVAK